MIDKEDIAAVEQMLTTFGRHADRGDGDALAELFMEHGSLRVGEKENRGRAAIAKFTNERCADPSRVTRHVWSNLTVTAAADGTLHGNSIQQTFEQNGKEEPARIRVSDLSDIFAKDPDDQWRFVSRHIQRVFST